MPESSTHSDAAIEAVVLSPAPDDKEIIKVAEPASKAPISDKDDDQKSIESLVGRSIPISTRKPGNRPTSIEVFTGQAIGIIDELFEARETTDNLIKSLRGAQKQSNDLLRKVKDRHSEQTKQLEQKFTNVDSAKFALDLQLAYKEASEALNHEVNSNIKVLESIKQSVDDALREYQWNPWQLWLYQWSFVFLLVLITAFQVLFIEFYCRWHGSYFLSLDLYSPANIALLSQISFVGGKPTTMSIAAEVLTWSSLGVWAQQSYLNTIKMLRRKFRFADDGPRYIGVMMRNTSIAAAIVIILRLSKFSLFGVSLEDTNPLAFDFTIGLSFLLGFFGDDAYRILSSYRDKIVEGTSVKKD